jgi:hypothetical protein
MPEHDPFFEEVVAEMVKDTAPWTAEYTARWTAGECTQFCTTFEFVYPKLAVHIHTEIAKGGKIKRAIFKKSGVERESFVAYVYLTFHPEGRRGCWVN